MNKQELIEGLNQIMNTYSDENSFESGVITGLATAIVKIGKLEEPEKVVIPQFVADWIKEMKQDERPLYSVISTLMNKTKHEWAVWKSANINFSEIVAQAWLDGYEVEDVPLYYVDLYTAAYVAKWNGNGQVDIYTDGISGNDEFEFHLTEEEIKNYDERFWPFAVEVAE